MPALPSPRRSSRAGGPCYLADAVVTLALDAPQFRSAKLVAMRRASILLAAACQGLAYKLTVFALTGRVNNSAFKGFAAGECLFLGAAGTKRASGDWEITFRFAASPNVTGLTIGDITGIDKKDSRLWACAQSGDKRGWPLSSFETDEECSRLRSDLRTSR
jgi:hypothetical protein